MGVGGAVLHHKAKQLALVQLHCFTGNQIIRRNNDRLRQSIDVIFLPTKYGKKPLRYIPYIGCPALHIGILHRFKHGRKII